MARPVQGYLANDGSFHETEAQADFRDAEEEIRAYCVTHTVDDNVFLDVIEALADPVYRYLNAKDRIDVEATRKEVNGITKEVASSDRYHTLDHYLATQSTTENDQADNGSTEDTASSLLEQPTDGHEPVPDMGSSPPAESILEQRESHGIGGRLRDARSLRSGETLAVNAETRS